MKLYELSHELTELEYAFDTTESETIRDEIKAKLDQFNVQFEFKATQIAKMVLNYESDIAQLKAEEERLSNKRKVLANRSEFLRDYLLGNMRELGISSINYEATKIAIQDNPYSVSEVSIDNLSPEFIRVIPEQKEPDKKTILEHFKQTGEIPSGCQISRTQRLVIK